MGHIEEIVRESRSYRQVAKQLGITNQTAKRRIQKLGINTSHFDFGRRSYRHVGKTFNRLTITKVYRAEPGRWFAVCTCSCGTENVTTRLDGVVSGHVLSCGCASRNRPEMLGSKNPAFAGCGDLSGSRLYWIKRGAEKRGITFRVSKEYLWALFESQNRACALSGVPLFFGRTSHQTTASLDRIDSTEGYIEGNLQWVHKDVNLIKRAFDQNYFLKLCALVTDHTRKQTLTGPPMRVE